jgi:hypothetical protein
LEAVKELSLSAVSGVLSENFLSVFFRRLLLLSLSLEKLVSSVGEWEILIGRGFFDGRVIGSVGLALVSIHLLISQVTIFLLLDLKSN